MLVNNIEDNKWSGCRCIQYGFSLCQNVVIVYVETLTSHIFLVSGVGPNLAFIACPHLSPLPLISHGDFNKLGERVLRELWCNFLYDTIGLGIYR